MILSELIYIIVFASIAVIITLYYTRKETLVTVNQAHNTETDVSIAPEWQVTEGFNRAIDQLGNEKMETRLGGIYALERISTESEKDYWPIMEILTAYVRKNSSVDNQLLESYLIREPIFMDTQASESAKKQGIPVKNVTLDIQVILTVLGRRKYSFESGEINNLNLSRTNLQHTDLLKADFSGANLSEANFFGANLSEAILHSANLYRADLSSAILIKADLSDANFCEANLSGADFYRANLSGANLSSANLRANLRVAHTDFLSEADLKDNLSRAGLKAIFSVTNLSEANFSEAKLSDANFSGADLIQAKNLKIEQLSEVRTLYNAKLDEELRLPLKEKYPSLFEGPK
jgi:uncharacterized protein YjbI with pentapeptide repeats